MTAKHTITRALDQLLTETADRHEAEVNDLKRSLAAATAHNKKLIQQRDQAKGREREYRGYAKKYQRELLAARTEIKTLRKALQ